MTLAVLDTNVPASGFLRPLEASLPVRIIDACHGMLQQVRSYQGVTILSPREFLHILESQSRD